MCKLFNFKGFALKITLFCSSFSGGGAEKVIVNLANYYASVGHEVKLIVLQEEGPYRKEVASGVNIISMNSRARNSFLKLRNALKSDDSEMFISALRDSNIVLGLSAVGLGKKLFYREANTMHAVYEMPFVKRMAYFLLMKISYTLSKKVICNSEDTKSDLVRSGILSPSKAVVVGNPVLPWGFEEKSREAVDHPWLNDPELKVFLNVGRLHWQKNHELLLNSFKSVRERHGEARLIILGEGELKSKLLSLAASLGISDSVDILSFRNNPFSYYRSCFAFVLSSRFEGFGNVLVEAMSTGTAIIATDCPGGPRSILSGGEYGVLVKNESAEQLTKAMVEAIKKEGFFSRLDESALIERSREYSVGQVAEKYLKVMTE